MIFTILSEIYNEDLYKIITKRFESIRENDKFIDIIKGIYKNCYDKIDVIAEYLVLKSKDIVYLILLVDYLDNEQIDLFYQEKSELYFSEIIAFISSLSTKHIKNTSPDYYAITYLKKKFRQIIEVSRPLKIHDIENLGFYFSYKKFHLVLIAHIYHLCVLYIKEDESKIDEYYTIFGYCMEVFKKIINTKYMNKLFTSYDFPNRCSKYAHIIFKYAFTQVTDNIVLFKDEEFIFVLELTKCGIIDIKEYTKKDLKEMILYYQHRNEYLELQKIYEINFSLLF